MKAFIPSAGMGTRLKPWTDTHPKALVPVDGVPMLERVVTCLRQQGISDFTVNVHHFAVQIEEFIKEKGWNVKISDERDQLLETGGGLLHASHLLLEGDEPILVHNVDILSNVDIEKLEAAHLAMNSDITLLVSDRDSSRKLVFDDSGRLKGWHSLKTDELRPEGIERCPADVELAFSGIYVVSPKVPEFMKDNGWEGRFSIIDFMLNHISDLRIMAYRQDNLRILDIGKPESLTRASEFLNNFDFKK